MEEMTPIERQDARMALLYELRIAFMNDESKKEYTVEEILKKLDDIAITNK